MARIYYNSWFTKYKKPFGAVKAGKDVTFRIQATEADIQGVKLVIRYENGMRGKEYYEMSPSKSEEGFFSFKYKMNQGAGLYFYYFVVKEHSNGGTFRMYYGSQNGHGGEGRFYGDENTIIPFSITCYEQAETPPDWYRESIFYQIFPDRFNNHLHEENTLGVNVLNPKANIFIYGQTTDEPFYVKGEDGGIARWDFYGGTLQGIIDKIPYLKEELGVTAIYLNPIFEARSNHRYDTSDYFNIDPMLGNERTFRKLVNKLHENDMHIILDGVFSHVGKNSYYFNADGSYGSDIGASKNQSSIYYDWFKFIHWPREYKSWWGIDDLPEIDKYNRGFQEYIYGDVDSVLAKWNSFNIDGWRLDVADELPDEFIQGIRKNLDTYPEKILIGEVWEDASRKISYDKRRDYILGHGLHSCMNYPFRDIILGVLNGQLKPADAAIQLTTLQENYPKDVFLNNFNNVGTHDTERILTMVGENKRKVNLAFGLMSMLPGVPCFYYGDEAGLTGGKDPSNRKFFPWGNEDEELMKSMKKWINIRKRENAIVIGDFVPFYSDKLLGVMRFTEKGYTMYVVNPTGVKQKIWSDELNFTSECPLSYEKIRQILDEVEIEAFDGYFLSERVGIEVVR
ncbi:alpha-glucosidase [Pilibacter termitis]|uniref:Alpha-glucosidase n=1 Tax=Pilibacter termitis TaxID=263852 RepID=A0A1T4R5X4_9ENTE|nr:glycoside hydrolase family 13 protein [Pilibacter termitis]SKA11295.1 alpha-glucosidase [Pilibacter termitis]